MEKAITLEARRRRNLKSVREAIAGIVESRKEIFDWNKRKPKLTSAEVKSRIKEGRR